MRYTFPRPAPEFAFQRTGYSLPAERPFEVRVNLSRRFAGCKEVLAHVATAKRPLREEQWLIARCEGGPRARTAIINVSPSAVFQGPVEIWGQVQPLPKTDVEERRFVLDRVPEGARLGFSYGIEAAGWNPDAAAALFEVHAEGEERALFEARLDPARNPADRRWFSHSVNLAPFAGRALTLVFSSRIDRADGRTVYTAPVWGNPTLYARGRDEAQRNLILISLDTLRAQSLGAYGRERPTSPFFDSLAREGVLFETALAQATTTTPSHMTLFTSLYPSTHGTARVLTESKEMERYVTLPELLRRRGYATGAVTEDGMLIASVGFERGFDDYAENKNIQQRSGNLLMQTGFIEKTFGDAGDWLERHRGESFFLFVHTYQVHNPYSPPEGYHGMFGPPQAQGLGASLDRYEEEIRYADDQLVKLWAKVQSLGLADRTLLVVTSDHGEEFGEHGALFHGSQLYDETLRVPLLMRAPGLLPAGMRVPDQVGLIDVLPTLLDLLGLDPVEQAQGLSLAPLVRGEEAARDRLRAVLSERALYAEAWSSHRMLAGGGVDPKWRAPTYGQRTPHWKFLWTPADPQLAREARFEAYDLRADPVEEHDVSPAGGAAVDAGRLALLSYPDVLLAKAAQSAPVAVDAATMEKLRALGYVD